MNRFWPSGLVPQSPSAFLFAAICVVIATGIRLAFGRIGLESTAFAPYYAVTLIVALLSGWSAATFCATVGGLFGFWLFLLPETSPSGATTSAFISLFLYGVSCIVIIVVAESYRRLVTKLRAQEQYSKLLSDELAHRVKNTLAVVQTIIRYSLTDNPELRDKLCSRITALALTNERLLGSERTGSFHALLNSELEHFGAKVRMSGPELNCDASTSVLLSLLFHELATNAAKYGALAAPNGTLEINWSMEDGELRLEWHESGVPQMPRSPGAGFGSKLLRSAALRLKGKVEKQFNPDGLTCMLWLKIGEAAVDTSPDAGNSSISIDRRGDSVRPGQGRKKVVNVSSRELAQPQDIAG